MQHTSEKKPFQFALAGNPNAGKSSIFNLLTGLRQKVGNFPGVTVEQKVGRAALSNACEITLIDLPGTYSLYPNAQDERVVLNILSNPRDTNYPDAVVYVADLTNLERHLLLLTQIIDLQLPVVLVVNMIDLAAEYDIEWDAAKLAQRLNIPVVALNGRTGEGVANLKIAMAQLAQSPTERLSAASASPLPFYTLQDMEQRIAQRLRPLLPIESDFQAVLWAHHADKLPFLGQFEKNLIKTICQEEKFEDLRQQINETLHRFSKIERLVRQSLQKNVHKRLTLTDRIDRVVTHPVAGQLIFLAVMFLVFQAIFSWAAAPMDFIEHTFAQLSSSIKAQLPVTWWSSLITEGLIAGLSGVLTFVPQIAILFFLVSLLEEVGYMARSVYLFDRVMMRFGMNGRSIVSLISGGACAIPAIMATRTISNWKERLITIMVTPLISCSARIPVYALLVGFVVPSERVWGVLNKQGLVFGALYLLSIMASFTAALVFKNILKTNEPTFLAIELPEYRLPLWRNVGLNVWEKVKSFVGEAGKTILIVSVVLWFLATFGPPHALDKAEAAARQIAQAKQLNKEQTDGLIAAKKIESSYAGLLGKGIEPIIRPLGFDWKIGIALISSFAAREVFVGTMATIYSIENAEADDGAGLREQMRRELRPNSTRPVYDTATAMSLLIFYVFAMQCMSTLAVVRRETGSWKWAFIQFVYMTGTAYLCSFLVYQLLK